MSTNELMNSMVNPQPINVEEITGIKNRRILQPHENSLSAAVEAVNNCLKNSSYQPEDIDIVISGSISRTRVAGSQQHFDPALSLFIKKEVGLKNAIHFDVSNACSGMMTGVHFLSKMIQAGVVKNGIVVSGEQISTISETAAREIENPQDPQFGSLTVGDSGAAVILDGKGDADNKIDYIELTTCAEYSELCIGKPSQKTPGYALYTHNSEMHKKSRLMMWPMFQKELLHKQGRTFQGEDYDYIIQHQVGAKFVDRINALGEKAFEASMPQNINCLEEMGNTATTSHFIALHSHIQNNNLKPRTKFLLVPAASGLVTGCLSATISHLGAAA
ncbi:3-oxoacyl-ACP synthase III family protein [Algicola sagamiensis]|uniref:3-oxoacyl-ACP synthase III family protein n=1 Tax=Algicola sagamiensis TaxID=163869 RepID=UPI00037A1036|nr:3-oxoacyl-[acyl-carrier-protein] synthase III C-terminal domain-containing protein [Algicola sagamiensis]